MKKDSRRINDYRELKTLPKEAVPVADYAANYPCKTSNLYKLWRQHKATGKAIKFEIIIYKGINFII